MVVSQELEIVEDSVPGKELGESIVAKLYEIATGRLGDWDVPSIPAVLPHQLHDQVNGGELGRFLGHRWPFFRLLALTGGGSVRSMNDLLGNHSFLPCRCPSLRQAVCELL